MSEDSRWYMTDNMGSVTIYDGKNEVFAVIPVIESERSKMIPRYEELVELLNGDKSRKECTLL